MATRAGTIEILLTGNLVGLDRALARAEARVSQAGQKIQATGLALTAGITLPIVAIGGAVTRMGTVFDTEMTRIETLVGVNRGLVGEWRQDLLDLGPAVGKGPAELARALFVVTSAGIRGREALDVLEQSAKASALGLGETATIARSVTAAVQAYGAENLSATRAVEILTATVREGNLEATDLAGSLGRILGIASQVGVTFDDVGGFIATFTRLGVQSQEAVTALRGILNSVLKPAKQSEEALAAVGLSAAELRRQIRERGLTATLLGLVDAFRGNEEQLAQVIPNVRALAGVLGTAGAQAEQFGAIASNIKNSVGILDEAFERLQETPAFTFRQVAAEASAVATALGAQVAPAAGDALRAIEPLIRGVGNLAVGFSRLGPTMQRTVIAGLALLAALGPATFILGSVVRAVGGLIRVSRLAVAAVGARGLAGSFRSLALLATPGGALVVGLAAVVAMILRAKFAAADAARAVELQVGQMKAAILGLTDAEIQRQVANQGLVYATLTAELARARAGLEALERVEQATGRSFSAGNAFIDAQREKIQNLEAAASRSRRILEALGAQLREVRAPDAPEAPPDSPGALLRGPKLSDEAKEALTQLEADLAAIATTAEVLGPVFRENEARAQAYQQAIAALAGAGVTANQVLNAEGASLATLADRWQDLNTVLEASAAKQATMASLQQEAASILAQTTTPLERYNAELARLDLLLAKGLIGQKTFDRATEQAGERLADATEKMRADVNSGAVRVGEALIDGIIQGTNNLGDILRREMLNIGKQLILKPLRDALEIGSPSRKAMEIGRLTMLGMAMGLQDGRRLVNAELGSVGIGRGGGGGLQLPASPEGALRPIHVSSVTRFEVSAIDRRGVAEFLDEHGAGIANQVARHVQRSTALQGAILGK